MTKIQIFRQETRFLRKS